MSQTRSLRMRFMLSSFMGCSSVQSVLSGSIGDDPPKLSRRSIKIPSSPPPVAHPFLIKEIALQAGLSEATVDRVLNRRGGVRRHTAERVKQAIHGVACRIAAGKRDEAVLRHGCCPRKPHDDLTAAVS